jgi:hypothetical protein
MLTEIVTNSHNWITLRSRASGGQYVGRNVRRQADDVPDHSTSEAGKRLGDQSGAAGLLPLLEVDGGRLSLSNRSQAIGEPHSEIFFSDTEARISSMYKATASGIMRTLVVKIRRMSPTNLADFRA